jgi:hypothetical protein
MNKPLSQSELRSNKPNAVLVYDCKETGILAEGLIYEAGEKIITAANTYLEEFEADYCTGCVYYCPEYDDDDMEEDRDYCEGGSDKLEGGDCSIHDYEDFVTVGDFSIKLPSHLWLKLSVKERPDLYSYFLMGFIYSKGYITPPLILGNVYTDKEDYWGKGVITQGRVCWGDLEPSSNIKIAYNQFWASVFNNDLPKLVEFEEAHRFADIFLERIEKQVKAGELQDSFKNNFLLTDGKLKKDVKLHKLKGNG